MIALSPTLLDLNPSNDVRRGDLTLFGHPFVRAGRPYSEIVTAAACAHCGGMTEVLLVDFASGAARCDRCGGSDTAPPSGAPAGRAPSLRKSGSRMATGTKFGEWTVLEDTSDERPFSRRRIVCECACGERADVLASNLKSGRSIRCSVCAPVARASTRKGITLPEHIKHARAVIVGLHAGCTDEQAPLWAQLGGAGVPFSFASLNDAIVWADSVAKPNHKIRLRMRDPSVGLSAGNLEVSYVAV